MRRGRAGGSGSVCEWQTYSTYILNRRLCISVYWLQLGRQYDNLFQAERAETKENLVQWVEPGTRSPHCCWCDASRVAELECWWWPGRSGHARQVLQRQPAVLQPPGPAQPRQRCDRLQGVHHHRYICSIFHGWYLIYISNIIEVCTMQRLHLKIQYRYLNLN